MIKKILYTFSVLLTTVATGQCAMCRAVLESEQGQTTAVGINNGIVYLMAIPYILVAGAGYLVYRNFFRQKNN